MHRGPSSGNGTLEFIYFGGGTPSYLSTRQLRSLTDRLSTILPWKQAKEITFECEPGTLTESQTASHPRSRRDPAQPRSRKLR